MCGSSNLAIGYRGRVHAFALLSFLIWAILAPIPGNAAARKKASTGPAKACKPSWEPGSGITGGDIKSPIDGARYAAGTEVTLEVEPAIDKDIRHDCSAGDSLHDDELTYTWDAPAGTWQKDDQGHDIKMGSKIVWIAPGQKSDGTPAIYDSIPITCTIRDKHIIPEGEEGSRQDTEVSHTIYIGTWDAIIGKCDQSWIPQRDQGANKASIQVRIIPDSIKGVIRCTLNSSKLPGYCSNAGSETDEDLKFETQNGWNVLNVSEACTQTEVNSTSVQVSCFDYGAYGTISSVVTRNGQDLRAHVEGDANTTTVSIPRDEDNNCIADNWAFNVGSPGDDNDGIEAHGPRGDGFPRFDEYRGFIVKGNQTADPATERIPIRTNPDTEKDVFIYDRDNLTLGYFTSMNIGLQVHEIAATDWQGRIVNFNGAYSGMRQCGLLLVDAGWNPSDYLGYCWPGIGTPNYAQEIRIYSQNIRFSTPPTCGTEESRDIVDDIDTEVRFRCIAHELGHGVYLEHDSNDCIMHEPCPTQAPIPSTFCNISRNSTRLR